MKIIFVCLLILNMAMADAGVDKSVEGSVVLSNGEVLVGKMLLNFDHDIVLFSEGERRMVYPAHKIRAVYYYDAVSNVNRRFVSLKTHIGARTKYCFFEVVLPGDAKILRQQKYALFSHDAHPLDYNYFVYQDETLFPLETFRKEVYPRLNAQTGFRLDKIFDHQIREVYPIHEIRIVEYYNKLMKPEVPMARN